MTTHRIEVLGLDHLPEITPGDDLSSLVLEACRRQSIDLVDGDILVVTQKVVSKAEGRRHSLGSVTPSALAKTFAEEHGKDARLVELVLQHARRIVRMDRGVLITQTLRGFVCANSGIDGSNVGTSSEDVSLLPVDPDASARKLCHDLARGTGKSVAVIVSDTFGRPWREGAVNVAIGVSGMDPTMDYRGQSDADGRVLSTTVIAVADEIAAAAELVMGKLSRVPVAIVRGYPFERAPGGVEALLRRAEHDLFR